MPVAGLPRFLGISFFIDVVMFWAYPKMQNGARGLILAPLLTSTDHGRSTMAAAALKQSDPISATREEWDTAYSIYQARLMLRDADQAFGALRAASDRYGFTEARLEGSYGANWRGQQICRAEHEAAYDALTDAEQAHYRKFADPLDAACIALLSTPAPDMEAVRIKHDLLAQDIFSASEIGRAGDEVIAADVERLTGIVA